MANMSEIVKTSFNSTLVQLKGRAKIEMRSGVLCFNSTLVQLKADTDFRGSWDLECFNSTLVQLKEIRE